MLILIEVGGIIGALPTVGLVVLTAVVGVWLLRLEGISTLNRVQQKLAEGELPETELLEGVMLIIGGALLLTPGFATDFMGFVCLIPGLRRPIAARIIQTSSFTRMNTFTDRGPDPFGGQDPHRDAAHRRGGTIIDGEFDETPPQRDSIDRKPDP